MRKNIGDEIVVKLTNQIVQGKINVGTVLPSIEQLADILKV